MDLSKENRGVTGSDARIRAVSTRVIHGRIEVPDYDQKQAMNDLDERLNFGFYSPGTVLAVSTPLPVSIEVAVQRWLKERGFGEVQSLPGSGLLAIKGSTFHHDADNYFDELFCIVWLENTDPWDLLFPQSNVRIPLDIGTIVAFDPANVHGVVARGATSFDPDSLGDNGVQLFASMNFTATNETLGLFGTHWLAPNDTTLSSHWMQSGVLELCDLTGQFSRKSSCDS